MNNCRSCNAKIIWAVTPKGHRIPIDSEPVNDGNITLQSQGDLPPLAVMHSVKAPGIQYHKSHFATCPQSKKWKRT